MKAMSTEMFPMCVMDQCTVDYLLAAMAYHFKKYDVASKCIFVNVSVHTVKCTEYKRRSLRAGKSRISQELVRLKNHIVYLFFKDIDTEIREYISVCHTVLFVQFPLLTVSSPSPLSPVLLPDCGPRTAKRDSCHRLTASRTILFLSRVRSAVAFSSVLVTVVFCRLAR